MRKLVIKPAITNITSSTIDMYFKDIKKFPLLTQEEETMYLKLRKRDLDTAINKLMLGNLRLVVSIAKLYQYCNIPLEDLIQIGNIGLYKALLAYDEEVFHTKLSDYISFKIKGEILNAITTERGPIQIPRYRAEQIAKVNMFVENYIQKHECDPTISEIAESTNMTEDDVQTVLDINNFNIFSETSKDEEDVKILDTIADTTEKHEVDQDLLHIIRSNTTPIEFDIISSAFGLNCPEMTAEQLAKKYDLSVERIRFIINKVIKNLRKVPELLKFI